MQHAKTGEVPCQGQGQPGRGPSWKNALSFELRPAQCCQNHPRPPYRRRRPAQGPTGKQAENTKRIPTKYEENTKRIRREYEENTKTTPGHPPSNPLACGLPHALCRLAPDCPLRSNAAKATGIRAAPNHPQQSKPEARHYGPEPALRRLSRSAHPCAPFPVDRLRYLPQTSFRYEKKLGINSQFVPYYLLTGKTFLTNNSSVTAKHKVYETRQDDSGAARPL